MASTPVTDSVPTHSIPRARPPGEADGNTQAVPQPATPRRRWSLRGLRAQWPLLAALLVGVLAAWALLQYLQPHRYAGTVFTDPSPAAPLDGLVLDTGEPMSLDNYRGELVLLYFGYTYCPDVCPLTLSTTAKAVNAMDGDGDQVNVFMVSVDPERDTLDHLGAYMRGFDASFRGVGGTEEAIQDVSTLYGIFFRPQDGTDGFYLVDHTSTILGIDQDGNLKVVWDSAVTADALQADLEELLSS